MAELTGPWPRCRARYLFLFDKVVIVCKRRGYSYELKEVIELLCHKMTDDPMNNKDIKKVGPASRSEGRATAGGAGGLLQLREELEGGLDSSQSSSCRCDFRRSHACSVLAQCFPGISSLNLSWDWAR